VFANDPRVHVRCGDWRELIREAPFDMLVLDGVRTYCEVYGSGEPLVLMHCGLSTLEMLDPLAPHSPQIMSWLLRRG
jgi:hypothetical protein